MENSLMIKLTIGKTYKHKATQSKVVISSIKTGSAMGKPTRVMFGTESLPAHEFRKTYQHHHQGERKW